MKCLKPSLPVDRQRRKRAVVIMNYLYGEIMTKYYDQSGAYKAYSNEGKNLFSEAGEHLGYFMNGFLYDTKGIAIGHVREKKILAKNGQILYYTK
jgi:hypothetical protein